MPDWKHIVGERLGRTKLPSEEREEVVEEIALHFEECYDELCEAGSPDPEGYTLAQVPDWQALGRRIRKSKEDPMSLSRKVLIPGLMALLLAQAIQLTIFHLIIPLRGIPSAWQFRWAAVGSTNLANYVPWLLTLPLAGALGAWMARRAGARPGQRLTVAVFPALYPLALGIPVLTYLFLAKPQRAFAIPAAIIGIDLLLWIVVPAIVCALGALPLLFGATHQAEQAPPTQTSNS